MSLQEDFELAVQNVKRLPARPSIDDLLHLYSLYKQATEGDVTGKRPGYFNIKARKRWEAWAEVKGMEPEKAKADYINLVHQLEKGLEEDEEKEPEEPESMIKPGAF